MRQNVFESVQVGDGVEVSQIKECPGLFEEGALQAQKTSPMTENKERLQPTSLINKCTYKEVLNTNWGLLL